VVVGEKTGEAYVIDRLRCLSLVPNYRESERVGTQLPFVFRVPQPYPVLYWFVPPDASSAYCSRCGDRRYADGVPGWLESLQPCQYVVNV
jgi:hypothetical protein